MPLLLTPPCPCPAGRVSVPRRTDCLCCARSPTPFLFPSSLIFSYSSRALPPSLLHYPLTIFPPRPPAASAIPSAETLQLPRRLERTRPGPAGPRRIPVQRQCRKRLAPQPAPALGQSPRRAAPIRHRDPCGDVSAAEQIHPATRPSEPVRRISCALSPWFTFHKLSRSTGFNCSVNPSLPPALSSNPRCQARTVPIRRRFQ